MKDNVKKKEVNQNKIIDCLVETRSKMQKSLNLLENQLLGIGTTNLGKAISTIKVDSCPIQQLAQVLHQSASQIVVRPYNESNLNKIEKSIQAANLGVGIAKDSKIIRISVPMVSVEQREKLCVYVKKLGEDTRIALRNIRKETKKELERKFPTIPEDELTNHLDEIQDLLDKNIHVINEKVNNKVKSLLA